MTNDTARGTAKEPLALCRWPELPPPYDRALREAVRFVLAHFEVAGIIASGTIILDQDPVVERLRQRAKDLLAGPPTLTPQQLTSAHYAAACLLEDATDVAGRDPETATMLLSQAVVAMLQLLFRQAGRFVPRGKDLLAELDGLDPEAGQLARRFFAAPDPESRLALAGRLADRTIGARGFFEWEAAPEPVDG